MTPRPREVAETGSSWTTAEVEAIVTDYFEMLVDELSGRPVNKAQHNRLLQKVLPARSRGSIEFKHANISAVLVELGFRYVDGYKPRPNVQDLLRDVVTTRLALRPDLAKLMSVAADAPEPLSASREIPHLELVSAPEIDRAARKVSYKRPRRPSASHPNYLAREAQNATLGRAGELAVLAYEHERLWKAGKKTLAERIDHVARSQGDGLGYDISSFDTSGEPRLIEVKTTRGGVLIPFFASRNEVDVSAAEHERYHLYRVFGFGRQPRLFTLQGSLLETCILDPIQFRAEVA
ncbi:MAG: protein NO VEIN domain-containing protein [Gemmatimonadaceae bacterium]